MTIQDMIDALSAYSWVFLAVFVATPVVAYGYGRVARGVEGQESPHKYVYAALVYFASIPGIFGAVLTAYTLFILRSSLLEVDVIIYFAPIASMAATLFIIGKNVELDELPGFERLYGLLIVLTVTFAFMFMVLQTRIFIFFGAPLVILLLICLALFLVLKWGLAKLTGPRANE